MIKQFIDDIRQFAENEPMIESVILVGSFARGTNTKHSDIDLCIISTDQNHMVKHSDFIHQFGTVIKKQIEYYGACTSIRVWYENGLEVEFGMVAPSWIALPLDEGTYRVLNDGYQVIVDKKDYFQNLTRSNNGSSVKQELLW